LQGEVQELAIEEWLRVNFPLDTVEEIKRAQEALTACKLSTQEQGRIVERFTTKANAQKDSSLDG